MSPWLWLLLFLDDSACFHERSKENYPWPCWSSHCDGWWDIFCTYGRRIIYFSTVYQFVSEVLDSAAPSLLMHLVFTCTIEPGLSPSVLLLLVICDMETGISLIWVFLAFVLFAMFVCVKDTRFISLGMGVVGLRAASLCTIWQEPIFVGSSNHNPFAASLSHAWQAWSISRDHRQGFRIQKDWTRKRALASRISTCETGCQAPVWLLLGNFLCCTGLRRQPSLHACYVLFLAENKLTQGCMKTQSTGSLEPFSPPVTTFLGNRRNSCIYISL